MSARRCRRHLCPGILIVPPHTMLDLLDVYPATFGERDEDEPIPDPRSGEGSVAADPLNVGRDDDHSTKAGEHIPDVPAKDEDKK